MLVILAHWFMNGVGISVFPLDNETTTQIIDPLIYQNAKANWTGRALWLWLLVDRHIHALGPWLGSRQSSCAGPGRTLRLRGFLWYAIEFWLIFPLMAVYEVQSWAKNSLWSPEATAKEYRMCSHSYTQPIALKDGPQASHRGASWGKKLQQSLPSHMLLYIEDWPDPFKASFLQKDRISQLDRISTITKSLLSGAAMLDNSSQCLQSM